MSSCEIFELRFALECLLSNSQVPELTLYLFSLEDITAPQAVTVSLMCTTVALYKQPSQHIVRPARPGVQTTETSDFLHRQDVQCCRTCPLAVHVTKVPPL